MLDVHLNLRLFYITYCIPKCVQFAAVILEIIFQFMVYMWCPHIGKLPPRIEHILEYNTLSVNATSIGNSDNERHYNRGSSVVCKKDNWARMVLVKFIDRVLDTLFCYLLPTWRLETQKLLIPESAFILLQIIILPFVSIIL